MKRLTLLTLLVTLLSVTAFAQKGMKMRPHEGASPVPTTLFHGVNRQAQPVTNLTRRAGELVTPPSTAASETWYTVDGTFYAYSYTNKTFQEATADMKTVNVIIDGTDIYIQGLAYWFKEGWIKGTISGKTATFANNQFVGEDSYGAEYISGSNDASTLAENIVFSYDATEGMLTAVTKYIVENTTTTDLDAVCFWYNPVFSKTAPEAPQVVVLPDGVTAEAYFLNYQDEKGASCSAPAKVAVNGNDVYIQGFSEYLPEAWVKGTKNGNLVTFPKMQYMGEYYTYGSSYAFYGKDAVFTYDAETGTYSAEGEICGILADQYYDGQYFNPVLKKVIEKAATPANPTITSVGDTKYGPAMSFTIPVVDVDGNGLLTSKLSFQVFTDVEKEVSALTFKTSDYKYLEQDMTVIPYGFTEDYDFYSNQIYLNMAEYNTFNKIGIQSIYTGGGEEHKSDTIWFTIKEYGYVEPTPVVVPDGLVTEAYIFSAMQVENGKESAEAYNYQTQVGFDGNDVYIKGLSDNTAEMWIKATKNEAGKYVIPANQYMGQLDFYGMFTFDYYLAACDDQQKAVDIVLDYDAKNFKFTTDQTVVLNGSQTEWDPYQTFTQVSLTKFVEVAATPADATIEKIKLNSSYPVAYFSIPTVGTNGEALNVEKLYYTVWIEKDGKQQPYTFTAAAYNQDFAEDVTEVPYTHEGWDFYAGGSIVYFEENAEELQTWSRVGIQTIYYGAGEVNKSNIVWAFNETFIPTEVVVNKEGYATFYDANHSFVIPEGAKAYVVTAATTDKLVYSELKDVIPAGTAVMLEATAPGTYPIVVSEETVSYDGINLLHGSNVATTTTADAEGYLFYKLAFGRSGGPNSNKLGWYWGAENGAAFQIEPHRAWLAIPQAVASAPGYPFGGDVTGISTSLAIDKADKSFYDLQGRRVSTPVKGLYINKNKKVIIK